MIRRFEQNMIALTGNPTQHRYLLAVSGGADSNVLAFLFHQLGLDCAIAHCNFHLRGDESNRDMQLVRQLASSWKLPLFVQEFDTLTLVQQTNLSVEMMARKLRYDWFAQVGRDFDYIVTAHHANDAAETMLLNLARGTGLKGMTSIPEANGKIIRPLLPFTAIEIRNFARQHTIPFALDCTNSDENIKRNRIRHTVIPQLELLNPNLIETMNRNRRLFHQQYAFYKRQMDAIIQQVCQLKADGVQVDAQRLEQYPDYELILAEILQPFGFTAAVVEQLNKHPQTGTRFQSDTHIILVNRNQYLINKTDEVVDKDIVINSLEELGKWFKVERHLWNGKPTFEKDNRSFYISEKQLQFPIVIRHWHLGDCFHPLGCKGKQKLSDFFNNQKIDGFTKQHIALFCVGEDIAWIIGYRSDERYKLNNNTNVYFKIIEDGKLF